MEDLESLDCLQSHRQLFSHEVLLQVMYEFSNDLSSSHAIRILLGC